MFLDTSGDGLFQSTEPNAVTDPNGFYRFENMASPATYRVREIPGADGRRHCRARRRISSMSSLQIRTMSMGRTISEIRHSCPNTPAAAALRRNPYKISTCDDLDSIETHTEDQGKYFVMTNDIDLKDYPSAAFRKINYFSGVFDGQNYTLTDSKGVIRLGMFGQIQSAGVVKKSELTQSGDGFRGGLFGRACGQKRRANTQLSCPGDQPGYSALCWRAGGV